MAKLKVKPQSKQARLTEAVRALQKGQSFTVENQGERITVLQIAKTLADAGVMAHQIISRRENGSDRYIIAAV